MIKGYSKITTGWVAQTYLKKNNKFVCVEQEFYAGDQVERDDENGEPVDIDIIKEQYEPFDMVQPTKVWWVLKLEGCVDPSLIGPFETKEKAQERLEEYVDNPNECNNSFILINISKGSEIDV